MASIMVKIVECLFNSNSLALLASRKYAFQQYLALDAVQSQRWDEGLAACKPKNFCCGTLVIKSILQTLLNTS
jgi:hypothetical protein